MWGRGTQGKWGPGTSPLGAHGGGWGCLLPTAVPHSPIKFLKIILTEAAFRLVMQMTLHLDGDNVLYSF